MSSGFEYVGIPLLVAAAIHQAVAIPLSSSEPETNIGRTRRRRWPARGATVRVELGPVAWAFATEGQGCTKSPSTSRCACAWRAGSNARLQALASGDVHGRVGGVARHVGSRSARDRDDRLDPSSPTPR